MKRAKKSATFIFKTDPLDGADERELDFELDYLASLTAEERFSLMRKTSQYILENLIRLGYRKPFEIVKRA